MKTTAIAALLFLQAASGDEALNLEVVEKGDGVVGVVQALLDEGISTRLGGQLVFDLAKGVGQSRAGILATARASAAGGNDLCRLHRRLFGDRQAG